MDSGRLFSRLEYPDSGHDAFEFQTFTEEEMVRFAAPAGLMLVAACTNYDADQPSSADQPKIQFVLTPKALA